MESVDYVDLARSLIQPSQNSYQDWQRPRQWDSDQEASPASTAANPPAVGAIAKANETLFNHNHGRTASPADSMAGVAAKSTASPAPTSDRAAQLRAQLLAGKGNRKMTPDIAKSTPNTTVTTTAGPRVLSSTANTRANDPFVRPATTQPAISNADVDDLIASAAAGTFTHKAKTPQDSSAKSYESGEIPSHEVTVDRQEASTTTGPSKSVNRADGNGNVRPDLFHPHKSRQPGHESPREMHDARRQSNEVQTRRSSNAEERKRAVDKNKTDPEWAAATRKANITSPDQRNGHRQENDVGDAPKAQSEKTVVNGISVPEPAMPQQARPSLDSFNINAVPIEIAQWLDITNFHDEEYRTRELGRHNKRLELERQWRELEQEGLEDRTRTIRGPSLMPTPSLSAKHQSNSTVATTSTHTVAQAQQKPEAASPTPVKPATAPAISKRAREEETREEDPKPKAIKTEARPLESRVMREEPPDRPRRRSPLPAQQNAYESYKPPPRDRYDSYHGRSYGYDERERELRERDREHIERDRERERERHRDLRERERRDLEERERDRERYGRLTFEDEEKDRLPPPSSKKAAKGKKQWSGVPCVPCRYFKQGDCHRGSACTFLHE